jgi:hypothetical protein
MLRKNTKEISNQTGKYYKNLADDSMIFISLKQPNFALAL